MSGGGGFVLEQFPFMRSGTSVVFKSGGYTKDC